MSILEAVQHPPMLHAMVVHFPIVLAMLGVPVVVLCLMFIHRGNGCRWAALAVYVLLAVSAVVVVETGERARDLVPNDLGPDVWSLIEKHEEMADVLWFFGAVTAGFLAISLVKTPWVRISATIPALAAAVATAVWVSFLAHNGGLLVYHHGVGTPGVHAAVPAVTPERPPAAETPEPAEETPDDPAAPSELAPAPAEPSPQEPIPVPETPPVEPPVDTLQGEAPPETAPAEPQPAADGAAAPDAGAAPEVSVTAVSYVHEIAPLVEARCVECHNPEETDGGLMLTTIESMLAGGRKAGPAVIPGNPDESPLILYVTGELRPQMPKGEDPLTEEEVTLLRAWIAAGAPDDSPAAAGAPE